MEIQLFRQALSLRPEYENSPYPQKRKKWSFLEKRKKILKGRPLFDSENEIFFPRLYKSFFGHGQSDRRKKMGKKSTFPNHEQKRVYIRILSHPIVVQNNIF